MKNKIILGVIIFFAILFGYTITSEAAIQAQSKQVNSGNQFSIGVTSDISLVSYTIQAQNYNGLTFVTSTGGAMGNGKTKVSNALGESSVTNLATFTFKAPEVTVDTQYTITFYATGMGNTNYDPVPNSTTTATITVKAPAQVTQEPENPQTPSQSTPTEPTKSKNANLTDLGINPKDYDFHNFKSSRQSYTATVPYDVEKVEVWYKTADTKATVNVSGNNNLKVGKNTIKVVVTAEAGNTKTYTITVTRQSQSATVETPNTPEQPQAEPMAVEEPEKIETEYTQTESGEGLKSLEIVGATFKEEFSTNTYEYVAVTEEKVDEVEINAEPTSEKYKTEISGNENLIDGENLINIIVRDEKNTIVAVYQVTLMKNTIDQKAINGMFKELQEEENIRKIGLMSVLGLILVLIILYIIVKIKMKRNEKRIYEKYNTKTDEDRRMIDEFMARMDNQDEEENSININTQENFTDFDIEENNNYEMGIGTISDSQLNNDRNKENTYIEPNTDLKQKLNSEIKKIDEDLAKGTQLNNSLENDDINETVEKKKGKHF